MKKIKLNTVKKYCLGGSFAAIAAIFAAVPASAGEFVDIFNEVCLETAPKFEGAADIAIKKGATRGPDVFDSHTRYFDDSTPFSVQFRHLGEDTNQCEVVTPFIANNEETKDFYLLIEGFAKQQEVDLFSRAGFHQVVIDNVTHIFSYEVGRGAFVLVTIKP